MKWIINTTVAAVCGVPLLAQPPAGPEILPPTVIDASARKSAVPLSPAEAAKQRAESIRSLKEEIRTFDPATISVRAIDGSWKLMAGREILAEFGADRATAQATARAIQELRINQIGSISGSRPEFQYWLVNGKAPHGMNGRQTIIPVSARTVRAEAVGGTWLLTDGNKGLYEFGTDADAAKRAALVFWKYGFNQIGVIGGVQPTVLYPLTDPRQAALDRVAPLPTPSPLAVLEDASRTSLLLPGNIYAGPRTRLDPKQLEIVLRDEFVIVNGENVLARFGSTENAAKSALKALKDAQVTEVVRLGDGGFPLFLSNGQPIHGAPLGSAKTTLRAERLRVQKVRETWWVFEENRPVLDGGSKTDAELIVQVIRYFDLKSLCVFGRPEKGLRLLTVGR